MKRLLLPGTAVAVIILLALASPLLPLPNPIRMDVAHRLSGPAAAHLLGQDEYGRDVLSRLLWGARASLTVALSAAIIACVVGTALGIVGGYLRGLAELFTLRVADIILCFPPLLLALLVVTLLGPGASTLILVLSVLYTPGFARVTYGSVLGARSRDYVEAVRVLGASRPRIMLRTILPNVLGPVLVQISLTAAAAIVLESGLSFLGLGVVPPAPSWGLMIRGGRDTMDQAPLLLLWPCLALTLTILAINALCDALQIVVDPRAAHRPKRVLDRALPGLVPRSRPEASDILHVEHLTLEISTPAGPIRPVQDVSLSVARGQTLAIVGESGSGKTLTGLATLGLLPDAANVTAGHVWVGADDVVGATPATLRRMRGGTAAMVFQDSLSSMNPVHRVGDQIAEAMTGTDTTARTLALLARVGIPEPAQRARAYPHEMYGGMRQRAMIAMALAREPALLIADEPTTALDVTVQAQVLDLLRDLQRERGLAMVFITHSLPVVAEIADRVAVMYAGEIVEQGSVADVFGRPLHPYTAALLASAPAEDGSLPHGIAGTVPLPLELPPGCRFAPRCSFRHPVCDTHPVLEPVDGRSTRCHRWRELA